LAFSSWQLAFIFVFISYYFYDHINSLNTFISLKPYSYFNGQGVVAGYSFAVETKPQFFWGEGPSEKRAADGPVPTKVYEAQRNVLPCRNDPSKMFSC